MREIARLHSHAALETIVHVMADKRYPRNRLAAAQMILDRAYGKVPNVTSGEGGEGPVAHVLEVRWKIPQAREPIVLEAQRVLENVKEED
jgi:hypothetical protein